MSIANSVRQANFDDMELCISGFIKQIGEAAEFTANDGRSFTKREIVIATNEQYPEVLAVELSNENAINFNGTVGQRITVNYHFAARPASNGRYYNTIRAWRYSLS